MSEQSGRGIFVQPSHHCSTPHQKQSKCAIVLTPGVPHTKMLSSACVPGKLFMLTFIYEMEPWGRRCWHASLFCSNSVFPYSPPSPPLPLNSTYAEGKKIERVLDKHFSVCVWGKSFNQNHILVYNQIESLNSHKCPS